MQCGSVLVVRRRRAMVVPRWQSTRSAAQSPRRVRVFVLVVLTSLALSVELASATVGALRHAGLTRSSAAGLAGTDYRIPLPSRRAASPTLVAWECPTQFDDDPSYGLV